LAFIGVLPEKGKPQPETQPPVLLFRVIGCAGRETLWIYSAWRENTDYFDRAGIRATFPGLGIPEILARFAGISAQPP
jgi:hypothetical protein